AVVGWVATASAGTSYLEIAGQMVLGGSGVGLVSAPATEAIMGVVPTAKAGVGSAVNDATRLLGSTLGVAIIGSVYASIYIDRLTAGLPSALPAQAARAAHDSARVASTGHASLAGNLHRTVSHAFFGGFSAGCLVAAGVAIAGAITAAVLLPAQPKATSLTLVDGEADPEANPESQQAQAA